MMKADELMPGDLVRITEPDDFHGYIGEVRIINDITGYITVAIPFMHTTDVLCDDLEPIPLTKEILKKNFPEYEPGYNIGWWPTEDGKYHIEFSKDKMEVDMECGVDYVHELQHLLKFVKLDKEIEL